MEEGLRFNDNKLRYDLVEPWSHEQMVRVLTKGSIKYEPRNWEKGMKWSNCIASLKRHTAAFERGEDYDIDHNCEDCKKSTKEDWKCKNHTGELHAACMQVNAHFLTTYYKTFPMGDDRKPQLLSRFNIGLDIDEVLADFVKGFYKWFDEPLVRPEFWSTPFINDNFHEIATKEEFWMGLDARYDPEGLNFEPHCYITHRSIESEVTRQWLISKGFPDKPVYTLNHTISKAGAAKKAGVEIFVDDRYKNFVDLNNNGIFTYLMDAPHNQRFDVGHKRIKSLNDIK